MLSLKFFIDSNRNDALMLRLRNGRSSKAEIYMGVRWSPEQLEDALKECPQPKNLEKRRFLLHQMAKLESFRHQVIENGQSKLDIKSIKAMAQAALFGVEETKEDEPKKILFTEYLQKTGQKKAKSTAESFDYTISTAKKFDPSIDQKTLDDITYSWLADFEDWMKRHDLSQNTRKIHFGNIRIAMREAYKRELTENDPFRRFSFRPEKTRKRSVDADTLRSLITYPVEPFAEIYRDMFTLIFCLCGINTIDLFNLDALTADGRIEYKRAKTGRLYSIKVEPEAAEIIEKYRGEKNLLMLADRWSDHRNFRHQMNAAIRRIGKARGKGVKDNKGEGPFAHITSYWARHTWATIAASLDIPKETIAAALGHGGNTVTDIYIDFDQRKVDEANRKVLDFVFKGV